MSSTNSARVGLSLIRYLKPIRMSLPHRVPFESQDTAASETKIVSVAEAEEALQEKQKNPSDEPAKEFVGFDTAAHQTVIKAGSSADTPLPVIVKAEATGENFIPEKTATHWVELVLTLLIACRKLTGRLKQRGGLQAYRNAVDEAGKKSIRVIGAIIDRNSDDEVASNDKKAG